MKTKLRAWAGPILGVALFSLAYGKIAMAAFIGAAFSNNIGLSMIAGASVRYRLYASWGLSAPDITKLVFFCTLTLWLGFFALGGIVFVIDPLPLPTAFPLPLTSTRTIGLLMVVLVGTYLAAGALWCGIAFFRCDAGSETPADMAQACGPPAAAGSLPFSGQLCRNGPAPPDPPGSADLSGRKTNRVQVIFTAGLCRLRYAGKWKDIS